MRRINANWARSAWIKIAFNSRIENISSIANGDSRRSLRRRKRVTARLKHLPKWQIRITRVVRDVPCCHSKWKSLQLNFFLPALKCFVNETVDLIHRVICHGVTTNGSTTAMHHKKTAGSTERTIKGIGETRIERKIFTRIGVHLIWSDVIEPLGCLIVSLHKFRPKISREFADRIRVEQGELSAPVLFPNLQRPFLLIDADEHRCRTLHIECFHLLDGRASNRAGPHRGLRRIYHARTVTQTRDDEGKKASFRKTA